MKKLLMTLACCAVLLLIPITAYAAKDETDTYEYEARDGRAVLTRYATDSNATRVTVPDDVDGYEVIGLEGTFKENQRIEQIILPEGIEYLGDDTFSRCRKLNKINLPDSIYDIGANCFEYTSIKTIKIPSNLSEISVSTFHECEKLTNVNFENSNIKSIGIYAFGSCIALKSINLPDTLEYIGEAAFGYCDSIEELTIPKNVKNIELISWPIIYGKSLKRIINLTNIEWDKGVFEDPTDTYYNSWFTTEHGYEVVNSLMPNTTIYRHKKDSSEKYVKKYSDIINQTIFLSKECNSSSEVLKKAKSLMPEIQIKTLSCEISLENFSPAVDGSADFQKGYAGSGCFKISASNSALENDEYTNYIWFSVEPQKYVENNPSQPEEPEQPSQPEKPEQPGTSEEPEKPSSPNGDTEIPESPNKPDNSEKPDAPTIPDDTNNPPDDNTVVDNENNPSSGENDGNVSDGNNGSGNTRPSGGSSGGSGGGSSSSGGGGGRRSSGGSSSSSIPRGLLVSKPSITRGIWEQIDGKWKLKTSDGSYASSQWASLDGKWYLIGADGFMLTGWQMVNGKWYLLGQDGSMLSGWQFIDNKWYYMGADGAMLAGTTTPDGYAVNEKGEWIQ